MFLRHLLTGILVLLVQESVDEVPVGLPLEAVALVDVVLLPLTLDVLVNVPEERVGDVMEVLPSLNAPTVSHLYQSKWLAIEIVVDKDQVRELIPIIMKRGAEGIIEYPLYKVI